MIEEKEKIDKMNSMNMMHTPLKADDSYDVLSKLFELIFRRMKREKILT
jgi:hypothetical protein